MSAIEQMFEGDWLGFLTDTAIQQTSEGVLALFIVAIIVLPTWLRSGHVAIPAVLLVLFSGLLIPILPGQLAGILWGVIWIAGTIALAAIINQFR